MAAEVRRTACARDCPDACGILATVVDGKVEGLRGDPDHPVTRGFLCFRTSRFVDLQNAPDRLTQPLLRRGSSHEPIGWDQAMDLVAERLQAVRNESGPAAIFHYRSGGSLGILKGLADLFFDQFGPCTGKVGDICSGAGEAAQIEDLGTSDSNDLFDLLNARHILLWGKNPTVSNVHLVPVLKDAQQRGSKLVLIDPVHHKTVNHADAFLQPAPGADLELALGIARVLFETGRIDPRAEQFCDGLPAFRALAMGRTVAEWAKAADLTVEQVRFLADCLANGPTAILVGWGMQRRQRGGAIVRALDALCAVSGNLFCPGGGVSFYFKRRKAFSPFGPAVRHPRVLREPMLGADLLAARDPAIRFLWVTAGNPVAMLPDSANVARALANVEFSVVVDPFFGDTARRASLVLPAPTLLEDDDLVGSYGHHFLSETRPVVAPPQGVVHEVAIFQQLSKRVGLSTYPQGSIDELKAMALQNVADRGASLADLRRHGGTVRSPVSGPLLFPDGKVLTPNGRVQLPAAAAPPPDLPVPPERPGASSPLWLFSNSTEKSQASIWSGKGLGERVWIAVHPDAAAGMHHGQIVVVASVTGAVEAELRLDASQRRDVALMPKGGHFDRGQAANALIAAVPTDIGFGAAYLDCLVRIRPR